MNRVLDLQSIGSKEGDASENAWSTASLSNCGTEGWSTVSLGSCGNGKPI